MPLVTKPFAIAFWPSAMVIRAIREVDAGLRAHEHVADVVRGIKRFSFAAGIRSLVNRKPERGETRV